MVPFLSLLVAVQSVPLPPAQAPAGTAIHVRLTAAVGSFASRPGSPLQAVLIAPVKSGGKTILPAGSLLSGEVIGVRRIGLGMVHETASLSLKFDALTLPGGESVPIATRVIGVDNARETVNTKGTILLSRSTGSLAHRATGWVDTLMMLDVHTQLAIWAVRSVVTQVPEPEIYLPPGVELTLSLLKPMFAEPAPEQPGTPREFTPDQRDRLADLVASLPERTSTGGNKPADLINVLIIGSRAEVAAAFVAAGWTEARPPSFRAGFHNAVAVMEAHGVADAPMSRLKLGDALADMSWQKSFNDVGKRHHIRLWKQGTEDGQEIWIGAATRDMDFAFFRPGMMFTHKVEEQLDHERDKVAYDLAFTSCADSLGWLARPQVPRLIRNSTGDRLETDDRMAVVELNSCEDPRKIEAGDGALLPVHGGKFQRVVRREVLTARSELIRENPYWRMYEGMRYFVAAVQTTRRTTPADPDQPPVGTLAKRLQPAALTTIVSPQ